MLHPCSSCRRHVSISELACPFCGAAVTARAGSLVLLGRWSRAAVFASAALAGCYISNPPPQYGPPPPPPDDQQRPADPPNPSPDPTSRFARPPTARTTLRGRVLDRVTGGPLVGAIVEARGPDRKYARTDNQGNYVFSNLAPGTYRLTIKQPAPARILGTNPAINLANDAPQQVNLQVDLRSQKQLDPGLDDHFQNHPCENGVCAPYGAPPARRRVV